ncbi:MAG: hypothetical protein HKN20_03045, partial [Gemmatimonadetes bacterium]|nr:hypothetical protein [Gemmatimonadota bacterium]
YLAYATNETGASDVYLRGLGPAGGKWQLSTSGGRDPQWRGDGRELYYLAPDRSLMAVSVEEDPAGKLLLGAPEKLFDAPVQRNTFARNRYVPARDGQSFYCLSLIDSDRVPPTSIILNWTAELEQR